MRIHIPHRLACFERSLNILRIKASHPQGLGDFIVLSMYRRSGLEQCAKGVETQQQRISS
jgi:hypothetical protein